MTETKIRIGILGAGAMGATHAAAYRAIVGVEIAGIWSRTADRAQRVAHEVGTKGFIDVAALINDPSVEAIDICTPSAAHRELVVAALRAGKHVICETPFALSLEDVEAMIAASRAARRLLFVCLLMRAAAEYVYLRDQVGSGALGRLRSIALWRLGSYLRRGAADAKPHYGDPSTELMTFDFDVLHWLLGPPERLSAGAVMTEAGTPGEITAVLEYAGGPCALVTGSGIMPEAFPYTVGFRAVFDRGVLEHQAVFEDSIPASTLVLHAPGQTRAPPGSAAKTPTRASCAIASNASARERHLSCSALRMRFALCSSRMRRSVRCASAAPSSLTVGKPEPATGALFAIAAVMR